ncbi:DUF3857 domain-containing protein [Pelagicoccus enzymogenes]|uniref:DUF3857 domain-containing protein n=1 Tax=Pelagicoccus enzymogenes TaxID=2773457 RepID=UPI00280F31CF|nr:DUF3857 domain-containing protein [Pelagicoccus enzymogenes]MDQ8198773.1 DUF3857 domain-containing protein [Pelagicoccus enzymogenes]
MLPSATPHPYRFPLSLLLALLLSAFAHGNNWDEIHPDDLAATECELDPSAPAEVLYKEIIYDLAEGGSYLPQRIIKYHIRTKIYDQSALDQARRTKFWYYNYYKAASIHARVIKPDSSFIEVEDEDIVTQTESRKNGETLRSTTISIPQVEVGDIVEYKYRKVMDENYYIPKDEISFQEAWPIRHLHLKMKPYVYRGEGFKWASNRTGVGMEKGKGGFYEITLKNQEAYPEEPYQAPDSDARSWFTFYNVTSLRNGDDFWKAEGKRLYREMLSNTKEDKTVSDKAKELAAGKKTQEEKLKAFYDFCRSQLINSYHGEADRLTSDQRDDLNEKWSASKTLSNGFGYPLNINTVFCALARAEGIDARLAFCADRSRYNFTGVMEQVDIALPHSLVAIKDGDNWTFHNPGARYIPFGQLDWIHDNVGVLVPDKKELILIKTQAAKPEDNKAKAHADLELSEKGHLSGTLTLTAEGNHGLTFKQIMDERSESERKEVLEKALSEMWPNGEFEDIVIENADDPFKQLKITCQISLPNYAEVVGDRLFFQPNVEQRYAEPEFPSPERKTLIFFDFKYREQSEIEIKLPDGYALEAPSAPRPFEVQHFMSYSPKLSFNKTQNKIVYHRTLDFSGDTYPPQAYPIIKKSFDDLFAQDHHSLTLKKIEESAALEEEPPSPQS